MALRVVLSGKPASRYDTLMTDLVPSITVLAILALLGGAFYLWRKQNNRKQALLMVVLALVMAINVVIWTIPTPDAVGDAAGSSAAP
jgi:drug/metabolite transporter superfamily protein YnfA